MTTRAQLRKTALALPETAEDRTGSGCVVFLVRGQRFASAPSDDTVQLYLPDAEAAEFRAAHPTAAWLPGVTMPTCVRLPLREINGQRLNHWVRRAWLAHAPQELAAQVSRADKVVPGQIGDLPRAIGRPATQALVTAGITTLAQVADLPEGELRAMHGIGPKAVRILHEAVGRL